MYAFSGCSSLTALSLPSITSVGDNFYDGCISLSTIELPSVTSFGTGVFIAIEDNLITMTLGETVPLANASTFSDYNPEDKGAIILVPSDKTSLYDTNADGMWHGWTIKSSINTVTFENDGGSIVKSQEISYGELVSEPEEPIKKGYTFLGWYTDQTYSVLWDFDVDTVSDDTTLYAVWLQDPLISTPSDVTTGGTSSEGITSVQTRKGSMTFFLVDSNDNPLAYYPVELHSTVIKAKTDANGQVAFSDVTLENHELVVFDKEGNELGTINLNMTASDTNKTTINGNDVEINFNESAVSIDIEIFVEDDGGLTVKEVEINANPKTGATETALYIGEGAQIVNIMPYLAILATLVLIGGTFVIRRKHSK
jgi:uncharacterized repeat protein (TIGR02543 family)